MHEQGASGRLVSFSRTDDSDVPRRRFWKKIRGRSVIEKDLQFRRKVCVAHVCGWQVVPSEPGVGMYAQTGERVWLFPSASRRRGKGATDWMEYR
jgi:hypothetical protein